MLSSDDKAKNLHNKRISDNFTRSDKASSAGFSALASSAREGTSQGTTKCNLFATLAFRCIYEECAPVQTTIHFAAKFRLALGALSISRGKLASIIGVDKSLVGRWASGAVHPSDHNLSRITGVVADRFPTFTSLDWNREQSAFARLLGVDPASIRDERPPQEPSGLPLPFVDLSKVTTAGRGKAYEGFWKTWRASLLMPDVVFQDHGMIRLHECGLLEILMGGAGLRFDGWMMLGEGNAFVILHDAVGQTPLFLIFRGVPLPKAEVLEGILLMAALNPGRTPATVPILLERIGDLSGDREADEAHCEELTLRNPIIPVGDVPETIRACLFRNVGPNAAAAGGEMFLTATGATGLTRGSTATGQLKG